MRMCVCKKGEEGELCIAIRSFIYSTNRRAVRRSIAATATGYGGRDTRYIKQLITAHKALADRQPL